MKKCISTGLLLLSASLVSTAVLANKDSCDGMTLRVVNHTNSTLYITKTDTQQGALELSKGSTTIPAGSETDYVVEGSSSKTPKGYLHVSKSSSSSDFYNLAYAQHHLTSTMNKCDPDGHQHDHGVSGEKVSAQDNSGTYNGITTSASIKYDFKNK